VAAVDFTAVAVDFTAVAAADFTGAGVAMAADTAR
jgi:hypothetical protein